MITKNILYVGSKGTSGYAISTKYFIFNYLMNGYNVTYIPINSDNSRTDDYDIITKSVNECINKYYDRYDYFICNYIPDHCIDRLNDYKHLINNPNCKKILQTVWETSKLPPDWVKYLNNNEYDEIWLPSTFNKKVFIESGVTKDIKIKKYISYNFINNQEKKHIEIPKHYAFGNKDITQTYNFYYISTWNDRKNNLNTLKTLCDTFTEKDNVSFLMKTNYYEYGDERTEYIKYEIQKVLINYDNPPNIVLFPENYCTSELNNIHSLGDCYFLLHRGEGLGYSSYEAYLNHKPVIVTKFGGQSEYFIKDYPYFVDYNLIKVDGMKCTGFYQHNHQWAEPNYEHAKQLLKKIYEQI
jgi:hypothetical protein